MKSAAIASGLFLLLGIAIVLGWTVPLDQAVLERLRLAGHPGLASVPPVVVEGARALTQAGPVWMRGPIAIGAAAWLWARGQRRAAVALLFAVVGEELLVQLVKAIVHRPRPAPFWALVTAHSSSFPSGHAAGCMAFYPLLGWFLGGQAGRGAARIGAVVGGALAIAVGLTRILLGVHWTCDVAAGWLLGGAIALFAAEMAGRPSRLSA